MGGVIGATSNTFVLMAATLLLHARVDRDPVAAVVDPAAKTSVVSHRLAERLRLPDFSARPGDRALRRPLTIGLGAETFAVRTIGVVEDRPGGADLTIGQDILATHVFAVDFGKKRIGLVLPGEYRRLVARYAPVALGHAPGGQLETMAAIGAAPPTLAIVDLGEAVPLRIDLAFARAHFLPAGSGEAAGAPIGIRLGSVDLPAVAATIQPRADPSAAVVIGLAAFAHSRIILDLPHDRIWVSTS